MKSNKIIFLSILICSFDQLTKFIIITTTPARYTPILPGLIRLNLVKNKGAAFSIFSSFPFLLSIISLTVALVLILWIYSRSSFNYYNALGIGFLLGGTLGNGLDRWRLGYVVDFIELIPVNFPIFNFADISINIALIYLLLDIVASRRI